jgi:ribosome-associated protein
VTATDHALHLATVAARAAAGKLAGDVVAFDISERMIFTDVFVIASASNDRQVRAIVDAVDEDMLKAGAKLKRREGERDSRWVLLDYNEVIVHVQHTQEREYYALERLWSDCPRIELPDDVTAANAVS